MVLPSDLLGHKGRVVWEAVLTTADRDRLATTPGVVRAEGVIFGRAGLFGARASSSKFLRTTTVLGWTGTN
ncbi:hypothetical protein [Streptomyces sp. NPDC045470]|uniref:hypothetical protein n=1 Tax=Streptomyces sp. NPDC045470 TaxID=3155469 RepID=UPI0033FC9169